MVSNFIPWTSLEGDRIEVIGIEQGWESAGVRWRWVKGSYMGWIRSGWGQRWDEAEVS